MDDQTYLRIHIEAEAILGILAWCEAGNADLLNSVALGYEVDHNPHPSRKAFVQEALSKSVFTVQATNYFCTCDDRFLRRAKQMDTGKTKVVSPLELIEVNEP